MTQFISGLGNDDEVTNETYLARMRFWRNSELTRTDWTQLSDSVSDKAAWANYRQALRNLPASNLDPRQIELPVEPGTN